MLSAAEQQARVRISIFGRVQGVFFRASACEEARRLGISGWVKNLPNGSVEILAEGARGNLEKLVRWSHHGPAGAAVQRAEVEWQPFRGEFQGFRVTR